MASTDKNLISLYVSFDLQIANISFSFFLSYLLLLDFYIVLRKNDFVSGITDDAIQKSDPWKGQNLPFFCIVEVESYPFLGFMNVCILKNKYGE